MPTVDTCDHLGHMWSRCVHVEPKGDKRPTAWLCLKFNGTDLPSTPDNSFNSPAHVCVCLLLPQHVCSLSSIHASTILFPPFSKCVCVCVSCYCILLQLPPSTSLSLWVCSRGTRLGEVSTVSMMGHDFWSQVMQTCPGGLFLKNNTGLLFLQFINIYIKKTTNFITLQTKGKKQKSFGTLDLNK